MGFARPSALRLFFALAVLLGVFGIGLRLGQYTSRQPRILDLIPYQNLSPIYVQFSMDRKWSPAIELANRTELREAVYGLLAGRVRIDRGSTHWAQTEEFVKIWQQEGTRVLWTMKSTPRGFATIQVDERMTFVHGVWATEVLRALLPAPPGEPTELR